MNKTFCVCIAPVVPVGLLPSENQDMCSLYPNQLCSHQCKPVLGSYKCDCRPGYTLMADGKSCREDSSVR